MNIDEGYVGHAKALSKSGLVQKIFPILKEISKNVYTSKMNNDAKRKKKSGRR